MRKRKDIIKDSSTRQKKAKTLFQWSEGEELNLLNKLVEFSANNLDHEQFYPFLRNGSLADVPKIQIFDKIQQLKRKHLEKLESRVQMVSHVDDERDESFELSNRLWGENEIETETQNVSTSKAFDAWSMSSFEALFEGHSLHLDAFTPSFLEATKKKMDERLDLQNHHSLIKANLKAQLAQLKHHLTQTRFENSTTGQ